MTAAAANMAIQADLLMSASCCASDHSREGSIGPIMDPVQGPHVTAGRDHSAGLHKRSITRVPGRALDDAAHKTGVSNGGFVHKYRLAGLILFGAGGLTSYLLDLVWVP